MSVLSHLGSVMISGLWSNFHYWNNTQACFLAIKQCFCWFLKIPFPFGRHPHFFKNKLGKHWLWMCFCFPNGLSMGAVYTDQTLYTYYYLQIINICVLFLLGWLSMNAEAVVELITKYNVSWFQGCLWILSASGYRDWGSTLLCSLPVPGLLREYMLILSSPFGKAAKSRAKGTEL